MQNRRTTKNLVLLIAVLFLILLIADRYYWSQVAQWREDQSTNLWLGFTSGIRHSPVGLMSSRDIPNPNGMILLGSLLSLLPSLLSVSFLLSLVQAFLLLLVGWKVSSGSLQYFALASLPALSSVILRSSSVEFWNQYMITLINIFFIFWALRYLENQSLWNLPPIAALALLAPALYLAGIVNALVMILITLGMMVYKQPRRAHLWQVLAVIASLVVVSMLVTWRPFLQNVSLGQLASYNKNHPGPIATFRTLWESLFGLPIYGTFQWADQSLFVTAFKHADEAILTYPTKLLLRLVARAYLLQAVFAFVTVAFTIYHTLVHDAEKPGSRSRVHHPALRLVVISILFISLSYTISAWMNGPNWRNGERPDQVVQLLPLFLYFIFLLPVVTKIENTAGDIIQGVSYLSLFVFVTVNLLCGFMIIRDHLQYRGAVLSEADVPLVNKEQAIDFIARDWKEHSDSSMIPVDYDLGGGKWDWVPAFGKALTKWYAAPMTDGRGFDYELLRRYGLKNEQEGVQRRTFGNGRYLVTYAFEEPPQVNAANTEEHIFGRLRVTTVEK